MLNMRHKFKKVKGEIKMFCKKCGKELNENDIFCSGCGAKQVNIYKEVFVRNGISEKDFIANINKWFQWHPKAANITCKFTMDTAIGLLANKYTLNQFVIEYELFEHDNENQYALVKEEAIALVAKKTREFVDEWKQSHPNVKVVDWEGGTHARGYTVSHLMGGFGARNRLNIYILFKFPRNKEN
jgi:hypothetical protein